MAEWMGDFQMVEWAYVDPEKQTILSKHSSNHKAWAAKGGVFGVEFLDSIAHTPMMLVDDSTVYYAGGCVVVVVVVVVGC
jgi:hypothetical protein